MSKEIEQLLPHREPMIMIESLVEVESDSARATKTFSAGDYGVHKKHVLEPVLIECLAQTVAALQGHQARESGNAPALGMLAAVSNFTVHRPAATDAELEFAARIDRSIGPFRLVTGSVMQQGQLVAEGSLKFYIEQDATPDGV
jgi:predicted hotdog family 3-hydroxylacyl-ACP dehydratase